MPDLNSSWPEARGSKNNTGQAQTCQSSADSPALHVLSFGYVIVFCWIGKRQPLTTTELPETYICPFTMPVSVPRGLRRNTGRRQHPPSWNSSRAMPRSRMRSRERIPLALTIMLDNASHMSSRLEESSGLSTPSYMFKRIMSVRNSPSGRLIECIRRKSHRKSKFFTNNNTELALSQCSSVSCFGPRRHYGCFFKSLPLVSISPSHSSVVNSGLD